MKYLVANWKSNKNIDQVKSWWENMRGFQVKEGVEVIVCPPFPYLYKVRDWIDEYGIRMNLGAQDISPFPFGAYTGAVAVEMIRDLVKYVIVGHSERRLYFHETHVEVANKVERCIEVEITPIVCMDEPYASQQIAAIPEEYMKKCVVAYEPLDAIGTGIPDKPEHTKKVVEMIKQKLPDGVPVIYGGSTSAHNVAEYVNDEVSDGALVGGASLDADKWKAIIQS